MKVEQKSARLFHVIGDKGVVAIEQGPARFKVTASKENLSDEVTAKHYKVGALDALGKEIVLDKEMTIIDWKGTKPMVWYVYADEKGKFVPKHVCEIKEDALAKAFDLLK